MTTAAAATPHPTTFRKLVAWLGDSHWPLTALSFLSSFINMALPLVLVRVLSREEVGIFKVFFLYLSLFPLLSLAGGVLNGLFYWAGQKEDRNETLQVSGALLLFAAVIWMTGSFIFFEQLQAALGWDPFFTGCFIVAMLGALAGPFFEDSAIATGRIWTGALFLSGFEILRTSSIVLAVVLSGSLRTVFLVHVCANVVRVLVGYLLAARLGLFSLKIRWDCLSRVLKYAAPISVAWAFGVFIKSADQLILSALIPPAEFALYSIGCLAIPPLFIYEQSVTRVLIPRLSESFALKDFERAASLFREAMVHLGFFFIPSVAGLILFASPIINLLFTEEYSDASYYLELFALSYLFNIFPYDCVARANGDSPWIMRTFIAFSILTGLLVYPLSLAFGPFGALLSFLVAGIALRLYALVYSLKTTGWSISEMVPFGSLGKAVFVSLFLCICSLCLNPFFSSKTWWFLTTGPLFFLAYFPLYAGISSLLRLLKPLSKNVLIITQKIDIGGLERTILNLTRSLQADSEWKFVVFAYDQETKYPEKSLASQFVEAGVEIHQFHKGGRFSPKAVSKILWYIFFKDMRILHTQDLGSLIYGGLAKIISFFGVRLLHTQHSFVHLEYNPRYRTYERLFSKLADQITVVSEPLKETYQSLGIDISTIEVLENGIDFPFQPISATERAAAREEILANSEFEGLPGITKARWVLYLARLYPGKGQDAFISIWNELPADARNESIVFFVGPESKPGELTRLQELTKDSPESQRLIFAGPTSNPRLWLTASDIFVSCSSYEGMPIGPLEAAGSGVPCIVSDIEGHHLLRDFSCLVNTQNSQEAATEIAALLATLPTQEKWSITAQLRSRYSIRAMAERYAKIYERLRVSQLQWNKTRMNKET